MAFKGISDEDIQKALEKKIGIAKPGAKDYLMDFMSVAPALMGMPIVSPVPSKVKADYWSLRRQDDRVTKKIRRWLSGEGERPAAPGKVFRGIPKGVTPKPGRQYTHGTPWRGVAARGGKGAFGSPKSYDVYHHAASPETLYYRGGSLGGDPLESGRIMSAQGMTWDKILEKGRRLYKRDLARIKSPDKYDKMWTVRKAADEIRKASFEVDIGNKPGIWRQKIVPKELRKEMPKLRNYEELEEVVSKARASGIPEAQIAELPESLILKRRWETY